MNNVRWKIGYASPAREDLARIRTYTYTTFGAQQESNYKQLIYTAIRKLAAGPNVPGAMLRDPENQLYTLHVTLGTKRGRHFLLYRPKAHENTIEILRILHDASDLTRHL